MLDVNCMLETAVFAATVNDITTQLVNTYGDVV
jgi:hypothetical protein